MQPQPVSDRFELRHAATDRVLGVDVPPRRLLAIDGYGPPGTPDFELATRILRLADKAVRDRLAAAGVRTPAPAAIECLWRPGPDVAPEELVPSFSSRAAWRWEQLVELPPLATEDDALAAVDGVRRAAGRDQPLMRLVELREHDSLQILAIGGPSGDVDALRRLLEAATADGITVDGDIHQLFVSDPQAPAAKIRSILRVPIRRTSVPTDRREVRYLALLVLDGDPRGPHA